MTPSREKTTPTIADVARVCGVSKMTVSYVISGKSTLKPETRERVLRTMRELNYHPSAVARGLSSKKVHTIGLMLPVFGAAEFLTNPYANGLLQGALWQAEREGYNATIFTAAWKDAVTSGPQFRDGRTDGIIVVAPPLGSDILPGLAGLNVPLVGIAAKRQTGASIVDVDNEAGLRLVTEHLLEIGHRRIAYLTGNEDLASFAPRRSGFISTLEKAGITVHPELIQVSHFDGSLAFEQTSALLRQNQPPTAIIAGNDTIAFAVIEAARCAGIAVPRQLSVVGFDDLPAATLISPNLTTVHQPLVEIGERAVALLVKRIDGTHEEEADVHLLSPRLVVRGSSGPAPTT